MRTCRFAIVVSHPIQHFVPFYRALAAIDDLRLKVFFCSRIGLEQYFDREMNTEIAWKTDLTSGYEHEFLAEAGAIKKASFRTMNNPSIGPALDAFLPDVVLIYGYNQMTSLRTLYWCYKRSVPVVMTADSELLQERPAWTQATKSIILPQLLKLFTCFLTRGDNNENYYRHYGIGDDRFFRAPFTIDEKLYLDSRKRRVEISRNFRAEHGIAEDEFVAVTIGKVSERKRPSDIVDAARIISKSMIAKRRIRFVLAGNGPLFHELSALSAAEKLPVTWLGFVNVDRLPEVYCAADVLVHPSEADPHPLVCSEGACVGLPLVLSDRVGAVGPSDIAREGQNSIIFPCAEVAAIACTVTELARDPAQVERMGHASIKIYDQTDMQSSVAGTLAAIRYCTSMFTDKRGAAHR